jgi:hypothetical protein
MSSTQTPNHPESSQGNYENLDEFMYPYASRLASEVRVGRELGLAPDEWHANGVDLDKVFRAIQAPILEIGGPTQSGYYFLDNRPLPSRPVIGNVNDRYYDGETIPGIDLIIDGRSLPVGNESLGMVLSGHLPKYEVNNSGDREPSEEDIVKDSDFALERANIMMQRVARTGMVSEEALSASLRLSIAKEVYTKLIPGGVYLTDADAFEVGAYEALGFEVLATIDEGSLTALTGDDEHYLYIILRKPEIAQ